MENVTEVEYMYRDGANYKNHRVTRFAGTLTTEQRALITSALEGGEQFLPTQVGLPTLYDANPSHYDDDHVWHELVDISEVTGTPTEDQTAAEFAARFADITWDVEAAAADLEEWKDSTPRGPIPV